MSDSPVPAAPAAPAGDAPDTSDTPDLGGGDPAAGSAAQQAQVAKELRKLKLKVDGREEELPEEEVIRFAQMGKSANKRYEEAAQMRRQAEQFLGMLRDPKSLREVLTDPRIGVDLKKFAEEYVWEQIQEQSLSPEQKKQRDIERELQKYKDQEAKSKKDSEERQSKELHEKYAADYDKRITDALSKASLPKTPATVQRMANYMLQAVQSGYDLEPSDLVERVRQDYIEDVQALFGQTEGDTLLAILGEGVGKKIRESDLKRLKSTQGSQFSTPAPRPNAAKGQEKAKKIDGDAWRDQLKKEYLGK